MRSKYKKKKTIHFNFSKKHKEYIRKCADCTFNIAEGAVRAGKTVDNVFSFAHEIKDTKDRIHLATGSTMANAKLNIGDCNGMGLEWIFRGQCHWGKYKDNEALFIKGPATKNRQRIVIFAGAAKEDSYKKIRGNSYGLWIATEINLHHINTIREAFNRQLAAQNRKIFWDLNPDNPNAFIYTDYIDKYAALDEDGTLLGGFNYMHCTLYDNINIPEERKREIESQYDPNSMWYLRDIKGQRVIAEGLIYRQFADDTSAKLYHFRKTQKPMNLMRINLGMGQLFVDFCLKVINIYGSIDVVYCDSAEQTLILGIKAALRKSGLGWIRVENALKTVINDRIRATTRLMAQQRFRYMDLMCESLVTALCSAVWNPKNLIENERLDDGTSDIDSLDSFEYTFERDIANLIRYE